MSRKAKQLCTWVRINMAHEISAELAMQPNLLNIKNSGIFLGLTSRLLQLRGVEAESVLQAHTGLDLLGNFFLGPRFQ